MSNLKTLFPDGLTHATARRLEMHAYRIGLTETDVDDMLALLQDDGEVYKGKEKIQRFAAIQERIKEIVIQEARYSGATEDQIRKIDPKLALPKLTPQEAQRLQVIEERLREIKPQVVEKCEVIGDLLVEFNGLISEGRSIVSGKDYKDFGREMDLQSILKGLETYFNCLGNVFAINRPVRACVNELRQKIGV